LVSLYVYSVCIYVVYYEVELRISFSKMFVVFKKTVFLIKH